MRYLLDTGILLRLVNRQAAEHAEIRASVRWLKANSNTLVAAFQNMSEFWNVCTRPVEARGGLGLTLEETHRRLRAIERITLLLPDSPDAYGKWKALIVAHAVRGVQVHDAKLVALMGIHGITHILTLNPADFARYPDLTAVTPSQALGARAQT